MRGRTSIGPGDQEAGLEARAKRRTCKRRGREAGALAASAFGAGFGGSVWALVRRAEAREFADCWLENYATAFPEPATRAVFFTTGAGPAAMRL